MNDHHADRLFSESVEQQLKSELLTLSYSSESPVTAQAEKMINFLSEYKELRTIYLCALKEMQTKFDVLNTEFSVLYSRNPISAIHTRLKSNSSIIEKMNRKKIPFSLDNLLHEINDVAGVRVICSYIDDIYALSDMLTQQDDVTLLAKKDYIVNPKPNGYRSLHLVVSIPVFFANEKKDVKVEVQIRTIAMDFWASLEHQIKYKKNIPNESEVIEELKNCASDICELDQRMLNIRKKLEEGTEDDPKTPLLYQRSVNLDIPLM
ncbi:MAG: GTP pyrophosphokinase family protein [Oscillospiraceae bacterium]|nr:GTP pyrophosphokinase family protein [Oscillospiraceae bacterium]